VALNEVIEAQHVHITAPLSLSLCLSAAGIAWGCVRTTLRREEVGQKGGEIVVLHPNTVF